MKAYGAWCSVFFSILAMAGCCNLGGGSSSKSEGSASSAASTGSASAAQVGTEDEEKAVPTGKFADAKLADFEARAKRAGWRVLSSDASDLDGIKEMSLELDNKKYYAYVTVIDVSAAAKTPARFAVQMSATRALVLGVDSLDGIKAAEILPKLLAKSPMETATRDTLTDALKELGWVVSNMSTDTEDGLSTSTFDAEDKAGKSGIDGTLYDWSEAQKEKRVAVDGHRVMNVFVCQDCTARKTKFTSQVWQNLKAQRLLGKLTNP